MAELEKQAGKLPAFDPNKNYLHKVLDVTAAYGINGTPTGDNVTVVYAVDEKGNRITENYRVDGVKISFGDALKQAQKEIS